MNVSAELLSTLKNHLTAAEYEDFMWEIKKENNPTLASIEEWRASDSGKEFVLELDRLADKHGFFTSQDVKNALLASGEFGRFADANDRYIYGEVESLRAVAEGAYIYKLKDRWPAEQNDIATAVVGLLAKLPAANPSVHRTDYLRQDVGSAHPHRCYKLVWD